jgi:hypothetical protein
VGDDHDRLPSTKGLDNTDEGNVELLTSTANRQTVKN